MQFHKIFGRIEPPENGLLFPSHLSEAFPGSPVSVIDLLFGCFWGFCGGVSLAALVALVPMAAERALSGWRTSLKTKWTILCIFYVSFLLPCVWWWSEAAAAELEARRTRPARCLVLGVSLTNATHEIDWETRSIGPGWRYSAKVRYRQTSCIFVFSGRTSGFQTEADDQLHRCNFGFDRAIRRRRRKCTRCSFLGRSPST